MLTNVILGAQVSMTPKEADGFAGNGPVRLVTCPDGRVVGGMGSVGLVEHAGVTDMQALMDEVKAKRVALSELAAGPQPDNPRANLFTFTRI